MGVPATALGGVERSSCFKRVSELVSMTASRSSSFRCMSRTSVSSFFSCGVRLPSSAIGDVSSVVVVVVVVRIRGGAGKRRSDGA